MRKYVVHVGNLYDADAVPFMYSIEAENDKAALIDVCDLEEEPGLDKMTFEEVKQYIIDHSSDDSPFHMIFSVDDDKAIFEGERPW